MAPGVNSLFVSEKKMFFRITLMESQKEESREEIKGAAETAEAGAGRGKS